MGMGTVRDRVVFGNPSGVCLPEGFMRADMHFHTRYSDSYTSVRDTIDLAKRRGAGVAVTDHNLVQGSLEAMEIAKDKGVFIVPGIEISSWDGPHILVYFYSAGEMKEYWKKYTRPYIHSSRWLAIDKGTEWILNSLEGVNCVVSAAHPLGYLASVKGVQKAINLGILDESVAGRFDSYEVICGGMFRSENLAARRYADEYGIGYTGGSDGHILHELGTVVTACESDDLDGFLDSIAEQTSTVIGREKNPPRKFATAMASTSRFSTSCPSRSLERKLQSVRYRRTHDYPGKTGSKLMRRRRSALRQRLEFV